MAGTSNSIITHNVLKGTLNSDNVISGLVNTAFNPAYALVTQAGAQIVLFINSNDYKMYAQLKDKNGNLIYTSNVIDLPLETMVVDGRYDSNTKKLVLVLDNGNEIEIPLGALISGLVNEDDLEANYYDKNEIDTLLEGYWTKIEITQEDIDNWNAKQEYLNQGDGIEISAETTLKGNTSQESTTGANLQKFSERESPTYYYKCDNKGQVTINGNVSSYVILGYNLSSNNAMTLTAGTYKIKVIGTISSNTNILINGTTGMTLDNNQEYTLVLSADTTTFYIALAVNSGQHNDNFYITLASGNTATTERYTGKNPAPNPDYPYPINVVTGDNEVKVEGKNLFSGWTKGKGINSTTGEETSESNKAVSDYIPVDFSKNANYYVSGLSLTLNSFVNAYNSNKQSLGRTVGTAREGLALTSRSFTSGTPQGTGEIAYIRITQYVSGGGSIDTVDTLQTMLNIGSTASEYEPYQSQTYPINLGTMELCKIGDYQDYIYKNNGNWYKYGAIGKVVLDGSETWNTGSYGTNSYSTIINGLKPSDNNITNPILVMSNLFKGVSYNDRGSAGNNIIYSDVILGLYVRNTSYTSLADFKTMLGTNNMTVYYVLNTPTTTQITDTTLIEQLDNLSIGLSNKWIKNISQTNADLPFEIEYDNTNLTISANLTDYYTKTETNTLLNDKVGFTDYATASKGGVVRDGQTSLGYGITQSGVNAGKINAIILTYQQYLNNLYTNGFIGKGTLENVLDARIGDIQTLLDNLNTGSGV